jgi:hypothetical protein
VTAMGPRSIVNMVFVVLLAAALVFGLVATADMLQAAMSGPG